MNLHISKNGEDLRKSNADFRWFTKIYSEKKSAAIVFPENLQLGTSNLAVHLLFRILNQHFETDIFFLNLNKGVITGKGLNEFDFVFFTVDYEPSYPNILKILIHNKIEPLKNKRKRPILIGGGIAISSNPFPLLPFFDVLALGEAEVILPDLIPALTNNDIDILKTPTWAILPDSKVSGKRAYLRDLEYSLAYSIFTYQKTTLKMFLYEISRSCPQKCRFCLLSYSTLPPRYVPFHIMLKNLEGLDTTDLPLGLVGSSILDHPEIDYIIDEIGARFERVTVSSLKIDRRKFETLRKLKFKGLKTITIAPETGTYKLRKKINKNIRDQEIKEFIKMVNDLKFDTVKMYFIVGLPEEDDEDVEAINDIMAFSRKNFRGKISVTVSIFVPKPHTPFQYRPFPSRNTIRKRMQLLKPPKGVILHRGSYQGALNQTLFSRGDERLGHALLKALEEEKPFKSFLRVENYLFNEEFIQNLPFNLIDTGIDSNFLVREDLKASKEKITPPCDLDGRCKLCGVCSD